jgi:hypothetical protein
MLHFSDGISIDTSGELKILKLHDGYYIVGNGMLLPMKNKKEAIDFLKQKRGER